MRRESSRRKFLRGTAAQAGAIAGAMALAHPSVATASEHKPSKRVVTRPGEPITPTAVLSPGVRFGNLLFVSGQGAHDPKTRKLAAGPFPNQVRQCLENVKAVVEAGGSSMQRVLKCLVFLTDISNFQAMNEVYHSFFPTDPPARSTVAVKDLPGETPVEIECIAYID